MAALGLRAESRGPRAMASAAARGSAAQEVGEGLRVEAVEVGKGGNGGVEGTRREGAGALSHIAGSAAAAGRGGSGGGADIAAVEH